MSLDKQGSGQSLRHAVSRMPDGWSKPAPVLFTADRRRVEISPTLFLPEAVVCLLPEALSTVVTQDYPLVIQEVEFDKLIGSSYIVETGSQDGSQDRIVIVQRPMKTYTTRCVLGRTPEETNLLTVVLMKSYEQMGVYHLTGAWIGGQLETEDNSDIAQLNRSKKQKIRRQNILQARRRFWQNHAVCFEYIWLTIADLASADPDAISIENGELKIKLAPTSNICVGV